jgi:hypothetical protein
MSRGPIATIDVRGIYGEPISPTVIEEGKTVLLYCTVCFMEDILDIFDM